MDTKKGPNNDTSIKQNMDDYGLGSLFPEIERCQDMTTEAVEKYGGTGKVTITFTYKTNNDGVVTVFSDVSKTLPKRKLTPVPMHRTKKGKLSASPEGQYSMEDVEDVLKKDDKPVENIGKEQANIIDLKQKQSNG